MMQGGIKLGKIIAVVSGKGGTGKTSFTANVGLALAALGCHTLCLDCDITLRNLDLALGLSDRALMDFTDVIAGRCTLEDAVVQHPKYPKLHLLTAPLSARPVPIAPEQMKALLDRIRQTYDYCLIDAPAGLGMGFHLASDYADRAVVVTNTDASSLRDAQRTAAFQRGHVGLVVASLQGLGQIAQAVERTALRGAQRGSATRGHVLELLKQSLSVHLGVPKIID